MILIGIAGLKNSGKSTFAKALTKELRQNYGRVVLDAPFARPGKIICEAIFGKGSWYGDDAAKNQPLPFWEKLLGEKYSTCRRILQTLLTDVFRRLVHDDIWVYSQHKFLLDQGSLDIVVIDDNRFDNESKWIREHGGQVIHIVRMGVERPKDTHSSESGVTVHDSDLRFDFNSVEEMNKAARDILPTLIKKHAKL